MTTEETKLAIELALDMDMREVSDYDIPRLPLVLQGHLIETGFVITLVNDGHPRYRWDEEKLKELISENHESERHDDNDSRISDDTTVLEVESHTGIKLHITAELSDDKKRISILPKAYNSSNKDWHGFSPYDITLETENKDTEDNTSRLYASLFEKAGHKAFLCSIVDTQEPLPDMAFSIDELMTSSKDPVFKMINGTTFACKHLGITIKLCVDKIDNMLTLMVVLCVGKCINEYPVFALQDISRDGYKVAQARYLADKSNPVTGLYDRYHIFG